MHQHAVDKISSLRPDSNVKSHAPLEAKALINSMFRMSTPALMKASQTNNSLALWRQHVATPCFDGGLGSLCLQLPSLHPSTWRVSLQAP